jgi:hypothetical protein
MKNLCNSSLKNRLQFIEKQVVQKISTDPLYIKLAMPLGRFCPKVNNFVTMVAYSKQLGCHGT